MAYMKNIYSSIFGETPATMQARRERNASFQDMLNTRKQAAEQARTDNTRMARYNALGNVLTTMVQPLGWGIGGGFSGSATGGVQQYDNRQYLDAFNRAVKAADDIRNIGTTEAEYQFKLANDDYTRALHLEDEARLRRAALEDEEEKEKIRQERLEREYALRMQLAQEQAEGRLAVEKERSAGKVRSTRSSGRTTAKL